MNIFKYKVWIVGFVFIALFAYAMYISAWISDDALISLTQIVNLHHGDGLVFNFAQRVQAFTHPLWFLLLSVLTYITGDYYYTIIYISIVLSLLAIFTIIYYASKRNSLNAVVLGLLLLLFSKAFIDYSSSGLENPLTYFLFAITLYILFSYNNFSDRQLKLLYILFAMIFLNRMDYILIIFPVVITLWIRYKKSNIKPVIVSSMIVIAWMLFSLFYFGHFLPNTFYAKLESGYPVGEFIKRGLQYYQVQYHHDLITLLIIAVGVVLGVFQGGFRRALALGLIIYLLYIVKIGGDFMMGRFFAVPAFIATFLIVDFLLDKKNIFWLYLILLPVVYISSSASSPLMVDKNYSDKNAYMGVADERGFYFSKYGLISPQREWPKITTLKHKRPTKVKSICGGLGAYALSHRDDIFYIDICALTDPLLSQLPAIQKKDWRIGHEMRKIPTDYIYAVVHSNTSLYDKELNSLYHDIKNITEGNLWQFKRLYSIYNINTKNYFIKKEKYSNPNINIPIYSKSLLAKLYPKYISMKPTHMVNIDKISKIHRDGMKWDGAGAVKFGSKGISILFDKSTALKHLSIGFDNNDKYLVILLHKSKIVDIFLLPATYGIGIQNRSMTLEQKSNIDKINIFPLEGDGYYSIGWISYE